MRGDERGAPAGLDDLEEVLLVLNEEGGVGGLGYQHPDDPERDVGSRDRLKANPRHECCGAIQI